LGAEAEIVAVSSAPIGDPAAALKLLGVIDGDRFHLLVDQDHRAFRDFGCYAGGPRHGLFLIDRGGTLRAGYSGEDPFENTREVVLRVRQLVTGGDKVSVSR
jgi:hypothetical protein